MKKLQKLQFLAKLLKEHGAYVKCKESGFSSRFDFKFDKQGESIEIFNANKGENLFIWPEFLELCHGLGLSHYVTFDHYTLHEVVLRIY